MGHDEIQKIHGTTAAIHGTQKFEEPGLVNRIINNCLCSVNTMQLKKNATLCFMHEKRPVLLIREAK